MALTFPQLAQKVLDEEKRPLSPDEIWEIAQAKGYDREVASRGKTPARTIGARLYVDVRDNPQTVFAKTDDRPKRFLLRSLLKTKGKQLLDTPQPTIITTGGCLSRKRVDWETINKLTFNPDFRDLLKRIGTDIKSREIRPERYDPVLAKDKLVDSLSKRK